MTITSIGSEMPAITPPMVPGLEFIAVGQSQQVQIINGVTSSRTTVTYQVIPQQAGVFSIPSALPGAEPVVLTVNRGTGSAPGGQSAPGGTAQGAQTQPSFIPAGRYHAPGSLWRRLRPTAAVEARVIRGRDGAGRHSGRRPRRDGCLAQRPADPQRRCLHSQQVARESDPHGGDRRRQTFHRVHLAHRIGGGQAGHALVDDGYAAHRARDDSRPAGRWIFRRLGIRGSFQRSCVSEFLRHLHAAGRHRLERSGDLHRAASARRGASGGLQRCGGEVRDQCRPVARQSRGGRSCHASNAGDGRRRLRPRLIFDAA